MLNKNKRKCISLIIFTLIISLMVPITGFAEEYVPEDYEAGWGEALVANLFTGFAKVVEFVITTAKELSMDSLIYNQDRKDMGLTLLKGTDLSKFFLQYYLMFQWMGIVLMLPIGLTLGWFIARSGDNAQRKGELKDKLLRWVASIVLLNAMPQILDMMILANSILVSFFQSWGKAVIGTGDKGTLITYFKDVASDTNSLMHAIAYAMSVFLNAWLVFYYFIRDITISFLFLFFPLLAVFLPLNRTAVPTWFKEMFSNIFTQSVHAGIFLVIFAMAFKLQPTFANMLFTLTAFAMVIPFTALIKRFFGFEGNVGAGASLAGLGSLFMVMKAGQGLASSMRQGASNVAGGLRDYYQTNTDERLAGKNIGTSEGTDRPLEAVNTRVGLDAEDFKARKRDAIKRIGSGIGTIGGGATLGTLTGVSAIPLGKSTATMLGLGAGIAGAKAGGAINEGITQGAFIAKDYKDYKDSITAKEGEPFSEQEKIDQFTGLTSPKLAGTEFKGQEQKAILAKKKWEALGLPTVGQAQYSKLAPARKSPEELQEIGKAKLYTDKDMSVLYSETEDGQKDVLWTGEGDKSLKTPTLQGVNFNDGELSLTPNRINELYSQAEEKALEVTGGDIRHPLYRQTLNSELGRLQKNELQITEGLRAKTGISNINLATETLAFKDSEIPSMEQFKIENKDISQLTPASMESIKTVDDGFGFAVTTVEGTSFFRDNGAMGVELIGVGTGGEGLGTNSLQYSAVKFQDGQAYIDKAISSVRGMSFDNPVPSQIQPFNADKVSQIDTSTIQPNHEVIVTVTREGNEGFYNVINNSTGSYLGRQPIDPTYLNSETNGSVYHVKINAQGNWQQQYHGQPSEKDIHVAFHSKPPQSMDMSTQRQLYKQELESRLKEYEAHYSHNELILENELEGSF